MAAGFELTDLWVSSLGTRPNDPYEASRSRLRNAYHNLRDRAATLAGEIPQNLRRYTVHDITHMDALWETADLIGGPSNRLTPTEGFVLGAAFLIHDLGMGLAAWPGGTEQLMGLEDWPAILSSCFVEMVGRRPSEFDLNEPPPEILEYATEVALRDNHARQAASLALTSWSSGNPLSVYHLIEDTDLRLNYGSLIGKIAASHGQDLDVVAEIFRSSPIGAPVECPTNWTVNPLKMACLMRLADASHIDARRAPGFLNALRKPDGQSRHHWTFQQKMQRPTSDGDRLVFSSPSPFGLHEAEAWWLGFDTIHMVDNELRSVDALLADRSLTRMALRSVKGADSPVRLSETIPTEGWTPVDARLIVSDIPALVTKLGGEMLYGRNPEVAVRELIQNASDATRALRAIVPEMATAAVVVTLRENDGDWWLDVSDPGIGMSKATIIGPLLDFGKSYWGSQLMREEIPRLASKRFSAGGRFGIGFYATFMLGDEVRVATRRFDAAAADTIVLEFRDGLTGRPILRPASSTEMCLSGGTTVSVKLRKQPRDFGGILHSEIEQELTLRQLCEYQAPALGVDLAVNEPGAGVQICVSADDWVNMPAEALLRRTARFGDRYFPNPYVRLEDASERVRTIFQEGIPVARMTLAPSPPAMRASDGSSVRSDGIVVSEGLVTGIAGGICGIILGEPAKADRSKATLVPQSEALKEWANEQAVLWEGDLNRHIGEWSMSVSELIRLGADTKGLHIGFSGKGYQTARQLQEWAESRDSVIAMADFSVNLREDGTVIDPATLRTIELDDNVLIEVMNGSRYGDDHWAQFGSDSWHSLSRAADLGELSWQQRMVRESTGRIITLIAEAWEVSQESLARKARRTNSHQWRAVGKFTDGTRFGSTWISWVLTR